MSEHTTGPWRPQYNRHGQGKWRVVYDTHMEGPDLGRTIADVRTHKGGDARVMAAAPELLKAARNVVSAATENSRATYEVAGGPFEDLVDAIANAEGSNE